MCTEAGRLDAACDVDKCASKPCICRPFIMTQGTIYTNKQQLPGNEKWALVNELPKKDVEAPETGLHSQWRTNLRNRHIHLNFPTLTRAKLRKWRSDSSEKFSTVTFKEEAHNNTVNAKILRQTKRSHLKKKCAFTACTAQGNPSLKRSQNAHIILSLAIHHYSYI